MLDAFKSIDSFPKALEDFRIKTTSGAIVSILSVLFMVSLFFSEMKYFYKTETVDHLYVNTTRSNTLQVDFDFSFPEVACSLLSLDAFDDTGTSMKDAEGFPQRQLELGNTLQSEKQLEEAAMEHAEEQRKKLKEQIGDCGHCYGAGRSGECCNTCQDVKDAYERMGWRFKAHGILQCTTESVIENVKDQFATEGGCQVYGRLELNKGSGQFHIAPHKQFHKLAGAGEENLALGFFNLLDLISFTFDQFNITHTINSLSFGDNFPGIKSPLDGEVRTVQDTHGMYQYYIKVVPTKYRPLNLQQPEIQSNQVSGRGLPGIYFHYEVSPIHAIFEEKRGGTWRFIVSICAILGGMFSVMRIVDVLIDLLMKFFVKDSILT
eukprot:gene34522-44618_t